MRFTAVNFDALGYLRRFFDIDFSLPAPDRRSFLETNPETTGINSFFKSAEDGNETMVKEMLLTFFDAYDMSLRTNLQSLHRLGLTLASLPPNLQSLGLELVVALIVPNGGYSPCTISSAAARLPTRKSPIPFLDTPAQKSSARNIWDGSLKSYSSLA